MLIQTSRKREENRRHAIEYLSSHPCIDCGENDIVVLQFDHMRDKRFNVSAMIAGGASWARIEAEIAKCEVRCANCHHRKTARERGYRKLQATPRTTDAIVQRPPPVVQLELGTGETRRCRVCGVTKPLTEFDFRSKKHGTKHYICTSCRRDYHREWWKRNRVAQMPRIRRNRACRDRRLEQRIWDHLFTHACVDCGESDLAVLHFDHLRDKVAAISNLWRRQHSWSAVEAEIAKCEVRCANCHARRTAREQGSYRMSSV